MALRDDAECLVTGPCSLISVGSGETAAVSDRKLDEKMQKEIAALCQMNVAQVLPPLPHRS
jgi:hypothetical protein